MLFFFHREQEKRLADLEDSLKELQDAKDTLAADSAHDLKCLQAILRDKQEQLDETKGEIKTLQVCKNNWTKTGVCCHVALMLHNWKTESS